MTVSDPGVVSTFPVIALLRDEIRLAWTSQDTAAHRRAEAEKPDMTNPAVQKGLTPVGKAAVLARTAPFPARQ
jgi:hypothetical protein